MRFSLIVLVGILDQEKRRAFGFGPRLEDREFVRTDCESVSRSWSKLVGSAKLLVPKLILFRPGDRRSFCFEMGTQETLCFCLECDYCLITVELSCMKLKQVQFMFYLKRKGSYSYMKISFIITPSGVVLRFFLSPLSPAEKRKFAFFKLSKAVQTDTIFFVLR